MTTKAFCRLGAAERQAILSGCDALTAQALHLRALGYSWMRVSARGDLAGGPDAPRKAAARYLSRF
jgi:hypothetical protein